MKSKLTNALIVLALFTGLSLILYPLISDYINSLHQSRAIQSYEKSVSSEMTEKKIADYFDQAYDYNKRLLETPDAFYIPEKVSGYDQILDITGTGIMGYITIDKINVELPIYHSVDENILQVAVGHLPGTAFPVGGIGNHSVLSGHRGLPSAKLFSDLNKLENGDTFSITILNHVMVYQIDQVLTVLPEDADALAPEAGRDLCTLVTCTPYGINSHRLLVRGTRITPDKEKPTLYIANEAYQIEPIIVTPAIAAPMLLVLALVLTVESIRKKKRDKANNKKTNNVRKTIDSGTDEKSAVIKTGTFEIEEESSSEKG